MKVKRSVLTSIDNLRDEDLITLSYLYLYRAMDVEQLMKYVYHIDTTTTTGKRKRTIILKRLLGENVITSSTYLPKRDALQITNKGIEIVRYTRDIPNEIFDAKTQTVKKGYYTSADLKLGTRFINHQVHLNQLMLDFQQRATAQKLAYRYYDEKFLSQYVGMRPDGMITTMDTDFFIEIDMATESRQQLLEKWDHYREFIRSAEFRYKQRKIIVLFDIDNLLTERKVLNRTDLVKQTIITKILDSVTSDFEIVVGPREQLIDYLFQTAIPSMQNQQPRKQQLLHYLQQNDYKTSFGYAFNQALHGDFYNFYTRQITADNHIRRYPDSDVPAEFFIDFYDNSEMSVLHRIDWLGKNSSLFADAYHRRPKLIVVVNDLTTAFADFQLLGSRILGQPNLYLLNWPDFDPQQPLYRNLVKFGLTGEVFRILTPDLQHTEFVKTLKPKTINHQTGLINNSK